MPSTTTIENIQGLLSNFDNSTGIASGNLSWKVEFNDGNAATSPTGFVEVPITFGQEITVTDELSFKPSSTPLKFGTKKIYTNPGNTSLKLLSNINTLSAFEVEISKFNRSSDYFYRSYDLFESLSTYLFRDSYQGEEDFFGYANDDIEIGLVVLRAPHPSKIRNPTKYTTEILNRGAIGDRTSNSIDPTCLSSLISEDERIFTLVYRRGDKYYDQDNKEILRYSGSDDAISLNYFGSRDFEPLNLSLVGYDGRYLDNFVYDPSRITFGKYVNGSNRTMNAIFYPKKEHNTVESVYSISDTTPVKILSSNKYINNVQIITFTVVINGNTYTTNPISVNNGGVKLAPTIRSRDFSLDHSFNISKIAATFSSDATVDATYNTYLTKNLPPIIFPTVNSVEVNSEAVIDSYPMVVTIYDVNVNPSTVHYEIKKNGVVTSSGVYSSPISITTPGTYEISAYSENTSDSAKTSEEVVTVIKVFKKAANPSLLYDTLTLNGTSTSYTTITFTSPDGIPVYFTTNGEIPDPESGNCYIARGSTPFRIYETSTIKFYAFDGEYTKSDTITQVLTITKTNTLAAPTINSSNAVTLSNRLLLNITAANGDIYYTLDGTTPTSKSTKYEAGHYIFPNMNSSSIVVKAIAHKNGYNDSTVTQKTFLFNYACAPWTVSGNAVISTNQISLHDGAVIDRNILMNPNYTLDFEVLSATGQGILEISFDSIIQDENNYTGIYSKSPNPIISTTYSGNDYSIFALGFRSNKYDTENYKKFGEIMVSSQESLKVTYYLNQIDGLSTATVKSNNSTQVQLPSTFYCKVVLSNSHSKIESDWMLIGLTAIDYQRISNNSVYGGIDSTFTLGNLTFSCV